MATLTSKLYPSEGFHPTSSTKITLNVPYPKVLNNCTLHLHYTLPRLLFIDPYELVHRKESYRFHHWGISDLEKPVHALDWGAKTEDGLAEVPGEDSEHFEQGAELLLDVTLPAVPEDVIVTSEVQVDVPMHLRYAKPLTSGALSGKESESHEAVRLNWPTAFLQCTPSSTVQKLSGVSSTPPSSLSKRAVSLFYSGHMPSSTSVFIPISPDPLGNLQYDLVHVPLGRCEDLAFVEAGTAITVLICFFWLVRVSWRTATRLGDGARAKNE
ncbi:PIG-X [Crucibulum laeve]|uniref:Protein PBN1 n=1 Tax=Crucibulum laeve TaxID=68775 RepID=A0A5C3LMY8_9AGAR|nr:PIG-X [Crucibulum laeve]